MAKDILTAKVAIVRFGAIEIEGLLFDDGRYGVAVPQIANVFPYFQDSQNQASKLLKRLMGNGFKTTKTRTIFNRNTTLSIELMEFEAVLLELGFKGDPVAKAISRSLIGLGLTQIFSDAFGVVFEQEQRQAYLADRITDKPDKTKPKHFNQDWQKEASRVTGYNWQGLPMANFIRRAIYGPLGVDVTVRLNVVNPYVKGTARRENLHYEHFDADVDERVLRAHISEVLTLLKMSQSEAGFWRLMQNRFGKQFN